MEELREHFFDLWGLFAAGAVLHVLKRAGYAVRSGKFVSRGAYLRHYWDALLIRNVMESILFLTWISRPELLQRVLAFVGASVGDLPIAHGTAFVAGYFGDSVLDWLAEKIPALRKELPEVNGGNNENKP